MIKLSYQHCWRGPILCSTVHVDLVLCALSINHSSRASATCGFTPTTYLLPHSQHMSRKLFNFAKVDVYTWCEVSLPTYFPLKLFIS